MNSLKTDLHGKVVNVSGRYYKVRGKARRFLCLDGFGCSSFTIGSAVSGVFLVDGEQCRIEGYEIASMDKDQTVPEQWKAAQAAALKQAAPAEAAP